MLYLLSGIGLVPAVLQFRIYLPSTESYFIFSGNEQAKHAQRKSLVPTRCWNLHEMPLQNILRQVDPTAMSVLKMLRGLNDG